MRVYLDDDLASALLFRLLQNAGHDVVLPADVGLSGEDDAVHLTRAIRERRTLISRNYGDFQNLHNLLCAGQGHHTGIVVIRHDRKKPLTRSGIVLAIDKLLAAGVPIADQYIVLNQWR